LASFSKLARHQLASYLIPNLTRQFFQLHECASSSQTLMFLLGKLIDDP
jgi:hypothetical protein